MTNGKERWLTIEIPTLIQRLREMIANDRTAIKALILSEVVR